MPNPDLPPPSQAAKRPNDYPIGASPATPSLGTVLCDQISRHGSLRFPDFLKIALYHPTLGYYARETRQVGRQGDFFTSVSVGPLFGELLARRFLQEWRDSGQPTRWRIIECGAHDGKLAADVLHALAKAETTAFNSLEYVIPEPLPALKTAQQSRLATFPGRVRWVDNPQELATEPLPGIAFGNELLDALPFHIVEWQDGEWREIWVALDDSETLVWHAGEIHDSDLLAALAPLGGTFPNGYRTEIRTGIRPFLAPLARALESGLMIWADYGFARPDYYHPSRNTGTLRTFSNHQAGENPLAQPGELDITAHVDFTAVAEAAISLGAQPTAFQNQGAWLTEIARDWLSEQEGSPRPEKLRQFQTLTHPAHLGSRFHMLELSWNPNAAPQDPETLKRRLLT